MSQQSQKELKELCERLEREERENLKQLQYIFSLESSLYETRIHNKGEDINMEEYYARLDSNMVGLSKKIYEDLHGA